MSRCTASWLAKFEVEPRQGLHFNPLPPPGGEPGREYWILGKEPGEFAIRFNLEYPLVPQLAEAKKLLNEERGRLAQQGEIQPVSNRRQRSKAELYRTYLRVLDAEASGVEIREIAPVLFPDRPNGYPDYEGNRSVRDCSQAAKKLRDGDYRNLSLLEK